ncbi:C1S protein, partial [Amia calva]|nr:C1S protein [Amia calva]
PSPLSSPGWLQSPGYPEGYPADAEHVWELLAAHGYLVHLHITHLDLEESEGCAHDSLNVSSDGRLLVSLCGQLSFEELQSRVNPLLHSSSLYLSFRSDYSNSERHTGFKALYTVQDIDECSDPDNQCSQFCNNYIGGYFCSCQPGYTLESDQHSCTLNCSMDMTGTSRGLVSSPGHPRYYPVEASCSYSLSVDEGYQFQLDILSPFDIERDRETGDCIDKLVIQTPSQEIGPFCGDQPPPSPLLTGSHQLKILFSSDGGGANTGFTLTYSIKAKTCPSTVTAHASLDPSKAMYEYGDTVTVRCELGFEISMVHKDKGTHTLCDLRTHTDVLSSVPAVDCSSPDLPDHGLLRLVGGELRTKYLDTVRYECTSRHYTLEGEAVYRCDPEGHWRSGSGSIDPPVCVPVCGEPDSTSSSSSSSSSLSMGRIFGGALAEKGQIPWQLFVPNPRAGASLISDQWALTAAHVVPGIKELVLYGGMLDVGGIERGGDGTSENAILLESNKIFVHPEYKHGSSFDNDIALIKLKMRAPLGPNLRPICLPQRQDDGTMTTGRLGMVSGWGNTEERKLSSKLLSVEVPVIDREICGKRKDGSSHGGRLSFTKNMFCAGEPGKDSCKGDSGGPFAHRERLGPREGGQVSWGPYRQYGVVSWGPMCEERGYYTKVDNYLDWIRETMEREGK